MKYMPKHGWTLKTFKEWKKPDTKGQCGSIYMKHRKEQICSNNVQMSDCQGLREVEMRELLPVGSSFLLWWWRSSETRWCWWLSSIMNVLGTTELYTSKWLKYKFSVMCILSQLKKNRTNIYLAKIPACAFLKWFWFFFFLWPSGIHIAKHSPKMPGHWC